jgi:RAB protein geranylgeranyltransferase component A
VLHVDKNPYYGGSEAAFSLQEAGEWVEQLKKGITLRRIVCYYFELS